MSEVLILHCALPVSVDAPAARALADRLPYAYRLELERRDAESRSASLAGVALVLRGAARLRTRIVEPAQLRFPGGGKPYLDGGPSFSVSHCRSRVAVAVSDACEVGVDLEDTSNAAREGASAAQVRGNTPLDHWTATEAALKAVGAGLRSVALVELAPDLATARCDGTTIHLHPLSLAPGCVAQLATLAAADTIAVVEIATPW